MRNINTKYLVYAGEDVGMRPIETACFFMNSELVTQAMLNALAEPERENLLNSLASQTNTIIWARSNGVSDYYPRLAPVAA